MEHLWTRQVPWDGGSQELTGTSSCGVTWLRVASCRPKGQSQWMQVSGHEIRREKCGHEWIQTHEDIRLLYAADSHAAIWSEAASNKTGRVQAAANHVNASLLSRSAIPILEASPVVRLRLDRLYLRSVPGCIPCEPGSWKLL